MSTSLLHWHRDRPGEAEKIIVINYFKQLPQILDHEGDAHDARSWTSSPLYFACPNIRLKHEVSAGF